MPRYDFECPDEHVTEQTFSFADVPESISCPVENLVNPGGVCGWTAKRIFSKGTWFINNKVMAAPSVRKAHSNIADL